VKYKCFTVTNCPHSQLQ